MQRRVITQWGPKVERRARPLAEPLAGLIQLRELSRQKVSVTSRGDQRNSCVRKSEGNLLRCGGIRDRAGLPSPAWSKTYIENCPSPITCRPRRQIHIENGPGPRACSSVNVRAPAGLGDSRMRNI